MRAFWGPGWRQITGPDVGNGLCVLGNVASIGVILCAAGVAGCECSLAWSQYLIICALLRNHQGARCLNSVPPESVKPRYSRACPGGFWPLRSRRIFSETSRAYALHEGGGREEDATAFVQQSGCPRRASRSILSSSIRCPLCWVGKAGGDFGFMQGRLAVRG